MLSILLHVVKRYKAELNCNCYTPPCSWCCFAHFLGPSCYITYAFSEYIMNCGKVEL